MKIDKDFRTNNNPLHVKLHELWRSMMNRCYSPKNSSYHKYGGEGVSVCDSWQTYEGFLDTIDLVDGYDEELLIQRKLQLDKDIKVRGNKIYSYKLCKFVSASENSANRRDRCDFLAIHLNSGEVLLTYNREKFCREKGLDSSSVFRILKNNAGESNNYRNSKNNKTHHGWIFFYPEDFSLDKLPSKQWYVAGNIDTREVVYFDNVRRFALDNGLNPSGASACVEGRQKRTKNLILNIIKTQRLSKETWQFKGLSSKSSRVEPSGRFLIWNEVSINPLNRNGLQSRTVSNETVKI